MSLIYDALLDAETGGRRYLADGFWNDLRSAIIVRVDNVARYYLSDNPQEEWNLLTDFPNVAPPWPVAWLEYRQPPMINSEGHVRRNPVAGYQTGVLLRAFDVSEHLDTVTREALARSVAFSLIGSEIVKREGFARGNDLAGKLTPDDVWSRLSEDQRDWARRVAESTEGMERPRWSVSAAFFGNDGRGLVPKRMVNYHVMPDGSLLQQDGLLALAVSWIVPEHGDRYTREMAARGVGSEQLGGFMGADTELHVPLLAICFAHCKNVRLVDGEPTPPKLAKSFEKKHGRPPVVFKTLAIDPMREVLRREGQSEKTGLKRALHICRGHFSTYTPERPLFGKVAGQFWIPAHVRGRASEGVVSKQYAVKGPRP